jgi:hypothetical protein
MIFRTEALQAFSARDLAERARAAVANVPSDLLARTAAFLLLKDSKSSFAIEGEHPPQDRIQRWGRAIGEAGHRPIDLDEFCFACSASSLATRAWACVMRAASSANMTGKPVWLYRNISVPGMKTCCP